MRLRRSFAPETLHGIACFGSGLLAILLVLGSPASDATTYKWVDKQGQVHYSDSPPQDLPYEVVVVPGRPAAQPPTPKPSAAPAPAPAKETPALPATAPAPPDAQATNDASCVDALYQLELLGQRRPVFKLAPDGSRRYLDDDARPAEIGRLQALRDASCSTDPAMRRSQQQRAAVLMIALSPNCAEARDKLASYQDPASRTPDDVIERQLTYVEQYCRDGDRTDLWLGDWIRVRRR